MSQPAAKDVVRLALTPRWLLLGGVALFFIVLSILLGRWQWDRTQDILEAERAAISQPIAIEQVFPKDTPVVEMPGEVIGRPVTLTGTYVPEMQVAVLDREHQRVPGVWIVTGLRLQDGRVAAVLRGWTTEPGDATTQVPPGEVTVTGVLQPDEAFYADAVTRSGTVASISQARLEKEWNTELLPGFTTLQLQEPSFNAAPAPVIPTVQTADVPFPLQNFVYAFQWWIFAGFAVFIYLRWLLLDARDESQEPSDG